MTAAVQFQSLTKRFERHRGEPLTAVDELTLTIETGQVFGLLGPNGSGKTTTINMVCGLLPPTSGQIEVHGLNVAANVAKVRTLLGVVPQETALYNDLTAEENLRFHARLYDVPPVEHRERIDEVLELAGLTSRRQDRVGGFSGGMQRRLALARALLTRPDVVILDEPTLGVDVQSRNALWERIRQIAGADKTVILATNYMEEAEALADRLAILDRGRLVAHDTPAALKQQLHQTFLELEADLSEEHLADLKQISEVEEVQWDPPHARLIIEEESRVIAEVLDYLEQHQLQPRSIAMRQPNLNDVFLEITGRALRD